MYALTFAAVHAYDLTADNADGHTLYFNLTGDDEVEVTYQTRYTGTPSYCGALDIPDAITVDAKTYKVTAIGDCAMFGCRQLTSVRLPGTLRSIGQRALAWCDAIESIDLPSSIEMMGANVFDGCYALTSINVEGSDGSYTDHQGVLYSRDMSALISYTPGVEGRYIVNPTTGSIGDNAFAACTFLSGVTLPDGLTSIGDNAFYFCNSLNEITIPATVEHIGHSALADCINLERIEIAEGNGYYASVNGMLYDRDTTMLIQSPCTAAGMPVIPDGVNVIGENACLRNHTLTTLKLPGTVKEIRQSAFIDCMSLQTVEIPSSVTSVEGMAFAMCPGLRGIYLSAADPASITLGEGVFAESATDSCILYVPSGSIDLYAAAPQWREFGHIAANEGLNAQTITWDDKFEELMPGSTVTLNASATSGLKVSYILSLPSLDRAQLDQDTLAVTAPGHITITAYQNGDAGYLPANPVTRTFEATASHIDIMDDNIGIRVYGSYGKIIISGASDKDVVAIYDIGGQQLYYGTGRSIPVPPGQIYIVRVDGHTFKVAVR